MFVTAGVPDVINGNEFFINSQHPFFPFAPTTMKVLTSVLTVAFPLLVVAHGGDNLQARRHYARQASSGASSTHSGPTSTVTLSGSATLPSTAVNGSVTSSTSSTTNYTITLLSTNPTAVPLASIVSNEPSGPTQALTTTEAPGGIPSDIPNAPPLPNSTFHTLSLYFYAPSQPFSIVANLNFAVNYPRLDVVPPTDSPQVQQWIQEVANTGIVIPDFSPTSPGSCRAVFRLTAVDRRSRWMW